MNTRHIYPVLIQQGSKKCMHHNTKLPELNLEANTVNYLLEPNVLMEIICSIKAWRVPTRNDRIDFKPIVIKISEIKKLSAVVADNGYDS